MSSTLYPRWSACSKSTRYSYALIILHRRYMSVSPTVELVPLGLQKQVPNFSFLLLCNFFVHLCHRRIQNIRHALSIQFIYKVDLLNFSCPISESYSLLSWNFYSHNNTYHHRGPSDVSQPLKYAGELKQAILVYCSFRFRKCNNSDTITLYTWRGFVGRGTHRIKGQLLWERVHWFVQYCVVPHFFRVGTARRPSCLWRCGANHWDAGATRWKWKKRVIGFGCFKHLRKPLKAWH
jgi:hypothetical protein